MAFGSSSYGSVAFGGLIEEVPVPSAIMKQIQTTNLGADLYNGALII